ncbi:MAG TPA: MarR family transcriptional regulator [Acidimicrobiales bacterium]
MPAASVLTKPVPADASGSEGVVAAADQLLHAMTSIRRSERVLARRPAELATLTGSQVELIRIVLRNPGVSVAEAAKELRLAPNTVSTLVRQLTDHQMLVRRNDPSDRRVARLELTQAMQRKVGAFRDRRLVTLVTAMGQLTPSEQRRLSSSVALVERLAELLRQEEQLSE